MSAGGPVATTI